MRLMTSRLRVEVIEQADDSPYRRVALKFDADYATIVKDRDDFTSYVSTDYNAVYQVPRVQVQWY